MSKRRAKTKRSGPVRRSLKLVGALAAVLIIICVIAVVALILFFDPNDYKPQINRALSRQVGRPVQIQGQIHWSFYPWLDIRLGRVTVANAKGFGDKPMASIDSAAAGVRLIPLVSGNIKIGEVSLDGLTLRLVRRANGQSNYQGVLDHMTRQPKDAAQNKTSKPTPGDKDQGSFIQSLAVQSVSVDHANIDFQDAGTTYRVENAHLHTGSINFSKPFTLDMGADFELPERELSATFAANTRVDADLNASSYTLDALHATLTAHGPSLPNKKQQADLDGSAKLDLGAGTLTTHSTTLKVAGVTTSLDLKARDINTRPRFSGSISVKPFNPRAALDALGMPPGKNVARDALKKASLDAQFSGSSQNVSIKPLHAQLDATKLSGTAAANLSKSSYHFDLDVNQINLDRYGLTQSSGQPSKPAKKSVGKGGPQKIDLSFIRGLTLNGHLAIGKLVAAGLTASNADVKVVADNGVLRIKPLSAELYNGQVRADARIDARGKTPTYRTHVKLAGVQFQPLLKDAMDFDRFSGAGNLNLALTGAGDTVTAIERHLNGDTQINVAQGTFHGVDIREGLAAAAQGRSFRSALAASKNTVFHQLAGAFNVKNGVVSGNDLHLKTKALTLGGAGSYDLPKDNLDYTVDLDVPKDAGGALNKIAGLSVPLHLSGALTSPRVGIDVKKLIRAKLQGEVNKHLGNAQKSLRDKLREQLGGHGQSGSKSDKTDKNSGGKAGKKPDKSKKDDAKDQLKQGISHLFGH